MLRSVIKCFSSINISLFDWISPVKTVRKWLRKLNVCEHIWYTCTCIIFIDVFTPCNSHLSKIFRKYCDIVSSPSFCTFTCNEALYTVITANYVIKAGPLRLKQLTVRLILTLTILFYSILQIFYSILFYSVFSILYSILSCCTILYYALFCILFYNVFYSILFYSTLLAILFYSILFSILSILSCKLPNSVNIFLHR